MKKQTHSVANGGQDPIANLNEEVTATMGSADQPDATPQAEPARIAEAPVATSLPATKKGILGRLFGAGKVKEDPPAQVLVETLQEESAPRSEEDVLIDEELTRLEDAASAQKKLEVQDPLSLMSNDVVGVIEVIHAETKKRVASDGESSSRGGRTPDDEKKARRDMSWDEFQVHAAHQQEMDRENLGAVARCVDDFVRVFQWARSCQKRWCSVCNPIFSRLEAWLFSAPPQKRIIPEFVHKNWCGCTLASKPRKILMRIASNSSVELVWLLNNLFHVASQLVSVESTVTFPFWVQFVPLGMYQLELLIKSSAWGLYGARKAFLTISFLNKIQFVVALGSIAETLVDNIWKDGLTFTLRGLGLFRVFHWLMKVDTFAAINMFLYTVDRGSLPLLTVIFVVILCLVFFGVIGMAAFRRSFKRRCVWADTLEIKIPEQLCKRLSHIDDPIAVYNNCGPLQQCLDAQNLNNGFSSFDNMPSALLTLFQALSTDGQYQIMWACLQSEPGLSWPIIVYFMAVGIIVGQVLINVFVAVLANVLGHYRALFNLAIEQHFAEQEDSQQGNSPGSKHALSALGSSMQSLESVDGRLPRESGDVNAMENEGGAGSERGGDLGMGTEEEKSGMGKEGTERNENILSDETKRMTSVATMVFRSDLYNAFVMLAIFGNCMSLALIGSLGSAEVDSLLEEINSNFGIFFLVNFVFQVMCDGSLGKYFASGKHIYDFAIMVPTTLAIVVEAFGGSRESTTVLRSLGILRILRGCEYFFLRPIWLMLLEAAQSATLVLNLVLVLLFFLTSYLLLGSKLFDSGSLDERANFESFVVGFATLFQIMTGDSWSGLMYVGMNSACYEDTESILRESGYVKYLPTYMWSCYPAATLAFAIFYITFFVAGQYVFITLFLALILENFQVTNFMTIGEDKDADAQLIREEAYEVIAKYHKLPIDALDYELIEKAFQDYADFPSSVHAVISHKKLMHFVSSKKPMFKWRLMKMLGFVRLRYIFRAHCLPYRCAKLLPAYPGDQDWRVVAKVSPLGEESADPEGGDKDKVGNGGSEVKMRKKRWKPLCLSSSIYFKMAESKTFSTCVYSTIIASSIMLAIETPAEQVDEDDHPYLTAGPLPRRFLREISPFIFTSVFALEAIVKIVAYGFILPRDMLHSAYMQDAWNRIDFSVLIMSLLDLAGAGRYLGSNFTSVIKISRAFRPILLLRKNREMKKVVVAFIGSAKPILYALLFLALVTVMFSTMGMALFKGKFHFCNDDTLDGSRGEGIRECSGNMAIQGGVYMARVWDRPHSNFDSFPSSCLTLLKCLTLKWVTVLHLASDATSEGVQPVMHSNRETAILFFVALIVTGSFISLNFFVSFVVDGFYAAQGQSDEEQTEEIYYEWIQHKMVLHWPGEDVDPPTTRLSQRCRALVSFRWFQNFSAACVLTNVVFISLSHEGESDNFKVIIAYQNNLFFGIMAVEVVLNLIAQGVHNFWKEGLNRFDVALIIVTAICTLVGSNLRTISQVVRSFRLARFSRALFRNKLIEAMFDTVVLSIKQVLPVILVLTLGMSIFAVIGVSFFGTVKMGSRLGPTVHFERFGAAFLSLTQILFGDEWHQLMEDCALQPPYCTQNFVAADGRVLSYGDCGLPMSPIYFMSFKVLCEFTILNLFVGMILNNFSFCAEGNSARTIITEADIERFARIWVREADTKKTGTIPMDYIYKLMFRIGAPLGMYGTKQNIGRFLCVREHVRRQVEALDADATIGYGARAFRFLVRIEMLRFEEAMVAWRDMQKTAKRYGRELKERDMSEEKTSTERDVAENDFDIELEDSDDGEPRTDVREEVVEEDEDEDVAQAIAAAENSNHKAWTFTGKKFGGDWEEENGEKLSNVVFGGIMGYSARLTRRIVVAGEQMGYGGAPKNRGPPKAKTRKVVKKKVTHDYNAAKILAKREQEKLAQTDAWIVEDRMKRSFIAMAQSQKAPKHTWGMKIAGGVRWFVESMVSKRTAVICKRLPGYACYDDVFNALLYWNNKDDIIPGFLLAERRVEDDLVISEVANQLIEGLMRGAIFRRRRRKLEANIRAQGAMSKATSFLARFRKGREVKAEEERLAAARVPTPIPRPTTGCRLAAETVLYDEGGETERGTLATLILDLPPKIDSQKLAERAKGWGFKIGDEGVMGLDARGVGLLLAQEELVQPLKELKARRCIHSLSGEEARLLRMTADMNGIDLIDVPDIADLPYEDLATILDDSTIKSKLSEIERAAGARRAAEELEALKIRNGTKTPAEVAELRRVQKQKERLEKLNNQVREERAELQRQLEESKKHGEFLSKEYAHARREAAHFASEALKLASLKVPSSMHANRLPEQLDMTQAGADSPAGGARGYGASGALVNVGQMVSEEEPWSSADLEGTPAEVAKKLADKISIQKSLLERLEQQLVKLKSGDPNAGKRQPSSWAYRGDADAMRAVRQQKILEATKRRDERVHGNKLGPSNSIVAVLGLGGDAKARAVWRGGKDAQRKPNWM